MRLVLTYLLYLMLPIGVFAQIGIGTILPNLTSGLDISSSSKGVLMPRLTTLQRNAITAPTQSLTVFDTDVNIYYYYSSTNASWTPINVCSVKNIPTGGIYILKENDNGRILDFTSFSSITVQVPSTLPVGYQVSITQAGLGGISFVGTGGMIVNNRYGATKAGGRWAKMGIEVKSAASCVLSGDVK